jgi:hypothetical protein
MRAFFVAASAAALLTLPSIVVTSCSSDPPPVSGSDLCLGTDPRFVFLHPAGTEFRYTDEACRTFLDQEKQGRISEETSARTPTWVEPAEGAKLAAATPAKLSWAKGPGAFFWRERVLGWLAPLAHAHGNTTGDGYVVIFKDSAGAEFLRLMTQDTSWTPDATSWDRMKAARKPISARVVWAKYTANAIASGTQPVASKPLTFTIE